MNNIKRDEKYRYLDPSDPANDKDYMYLDLSDDHEMLEGETEDEFMKRCKDRFRAKHGIDYDEFIESKECKSLFESIDKLQAERGDKPQEQEDSDISK